jgi:GT2 family glycosyltransferase
MEEILPHSNILYLVSETNEGCGGGRNIGMREVDEEFDYLFIVDSDIYTPQDWDGKMVDFMEAHKRVGLAGPSTNYAGCPQLIENCPKLNTDEEIENYASMVSRSGKKPFILHERWPVIGFCQIIRKEVFDKVGFFDETFKFYGCEDNDYCWRVQCSGWQLAYIHNVFVYHDGHGGFNLLNSDEAGHWGKNREYFLKKHGWI